MNGQTIHIRNMVCQRCVLAVEGILKELGIAYHNVSVGEAQLCREISPPQEQALSAKLQQIGLELIDNRRSGLIEKAKQLILLKARNEAPEAQQALKLSAYLTDNLHLDYTYLSSLFSSVEGRTIENYFILQRIEKAKELLAYEQHTLSEIAWELGYSSTAHLSNQFRKVTGLTPTHFRKIGLARRRPLDEV